LLHALKIKRGRAEEKKLFKTNTFYDGEDCGRGCSCVCSCVLKVIQNVVDGAEPDIQLDFQ